MSRRLKARQLRVFGVINGRKVPTVPMMTPWLVTYIYIGEKSLSVDETIQLIRIGEPAAKQNSSLPAATSVCSTSLADAPWVFDAQEPGYGPGASMHDALPRCEGALGDHLVILGHFYQRDEVIQYADFVM
jgi:hypothetical protein